MINNYPTVENIHLDYEGFSEVDLKTQGAARYAEDKSTELFMASVSTDHEGPYLWVNPKYERAGVKSDPRAVALMHRIGEPGVLVWAHNAPFEQVLSKYQLAKYGFKAPDIRQWRCTQAICRKAAIPSSLEKAAEFLGLAEQKDKRGKELIRLFCIPQKDGSRVMPWDVPAEWAQFCEYCLQDNRTEREIHQMLKPFELTGPLLETFLFDLELNDNGIPVNVAALRNAQLILDEVMFDLGEQFFELTRLAPTQRQKVKDLLASKGLNLPDMTADTIENVLCGSAPVPDEAKRILELYSKVQYAAAKKVQSMLDCVCSDGYVRGTLLFYGAGTGRWAGRLIQPQNFKKPTIKDTDLAYDMIRHGCTRSDLDALWGNAMEVIASCIRNFIQPHEGDMIDADYAAIEARIVCWLAGQEDVLQEFREGKDSYKLMAAEIYERPVSEIQNPSDERELGKRTVLGCGFNMGAKKFKTTCWEQYGIFVTMELAERAVEAYRSKHWKVRDLWSACDRAARAAIAKPGAIFKAGEKLRFQVRAVNGIDYLFMKIPSGREIAYPQPKVEKVFNEEYKKWREQITFFGPLEGKSNAWGRVGTYGGKLVENATQGTAADIMAHGAIRATRAGFRIVTLIHDQAPALRKAHQTVAAYVAELTNLPDWAYGLPIKAEGKIIPYYKK